MFKKFFKFIALPFKSDEDITNYSKIHPKAGKVAKSSRAALLRSTYMLISGV